MDKQPSARHRWLANRSATDKTTRIGPVIARSRAYAEQEFKKQYGFIPAHIWSEAEGLPQEIEP